MKDRRTLTKIVSLLIAVMVSTFLVAAVAAQSINPPKLLDSVNIGDLTSETGHHLQGWTEIWSGCVWCGPDGNLRLIWGDGGEKCLRENQWASVTLDTGRRIAYFLKVEHLDGVANDGFNVYVNDDLVGSYVDQHSSDTWTATEFDISSGHYKGALTIKFEATGPAWPGCGTYGQVAFNLIELRGEGRPR